VIAVTISTAVITVEQTGN